MRRSRVASSCVEPGVFHAAGHLRRQQGQHAHVIVGEIADAVAFQIHHAHHAVLHHQRHGHLGADVGVRGDVARILGGIVHAHHLARFRGGAGDALAQRNVIDVDPLVVADAEQVAQRLGLVVHRAGC